MYVDVESAAERKRILVTGGTGVLGRAVTPLLAADGHEVHAPNHEDLDLFDPEEVEEAVAGMDAVMHLATRIPKLERMEEREAWRENDRLRTEGAHLLVGAALAAAVDTFVFPSIALFYPDDGRADEDTPLADVPPPMRSALVAEDETARFAAAGHRGVSLRLGLLDGPGTGNDEPITAFGATISSIDAARALVAGLGAPSGIYNVVRDGERVPNIRFKRATGWKPLA